ncbi:MAG: hypothetical protein GY756_09880 [bacterium]|nr:hypothetical protein [bacterium]
MQKIKEETKYMGRVEEKHKNIDENFENMVRDVQMYDFENMVRNAQMYVENKKIEVTDNISHGLASNILKEIKSKIKELDTKRKEMTKPIDESKKRIMAFFSVPMEILTNKERELKQSITTYISLQERLFREKQEKARIEVEKEEARKLKILDQKIERAEASGKIDKAENLRIEKEEVFVPIQKLETTMPKIAGQSMRKIWKHKINDIRLIPREYLVVDNQKIAAIARATKGTLTIPGVTFYAENYLASSS